MMKLQPNGKNTTLNSRGASFLEDTSHSTNYRNESNDTRRTSDDNITNPASNRHTDSQDGDPVFMTRKEGPFYSTGSGPYSGKDYVDELEELTISDREVNEPFHSNINRNVDATFSNSNFIGSQRNISHSNEVEELKYMSAVHLHRATTLIKVFCFLKCLWKSRARSIEKIIAIYNKQTKKALMTCFLNWKHEALLQGMLEDAEQEEEFCDSEQFNGSDEEIEQFLDDEASILQSKFQKRRFFQCLRSRANAQKLLSQADRFRYFSLLFRVLTAWIQASEKSRKSVRTEQTSCDISRYIVVPQDTDRKDSNCSYFIAESDIKRNQAISPSFSFNPNALPVKELNFNEVSRNESVLTCELENYITFKYLIKTFQALKTIALVQKKKRRLNKLYKSRVRAKYLSKFFSIWINKFIVKRNIEELILRIQRVQTKLTLHKLKQHSIESISRVGYFRQEGRIRRQSGTIRRQSLEHGNYSAVELQQPIYEPTVSKLNTSFEAPNQKNKLQSHLTKVFNNKSDNTPPVPQTKPRNLSTSNSYTNTSNYSSGTIPKAQQSSNQRIPPKNHPPRDPKKVEAPKNNLPVGPRRGSTAGTLKDKSADKENRSPFQKQPPVSRVRDTSFEKMVGDLQGHLRFLNKKLMEEKLNQKKLENIREALCSNSSFYTNTSFC